MIVGSILLIFVAVGLLIGGVLGGSNALIVCCIIVVVLAAVVLVLGVKQSTASGAVFGIDIDGEADETSEYPVVPGRVGRVRQPDRRVIDQMRALGSSSRRGARAASAVPAVAVGHGRIIVDEQVVRGIPSQGTPDHSSVGRVTAPYGAAVPGRPSHAAPDDDPSGPPIQPFDGPAYETLRDDPADLMTVTEIIDAHDIAALDIEALDVARLDVEAGTVEARDFEALDGEIRHIEILDVEVRDVEVRDIEVRDIEVRDVEVRDVEARDVEARDFGAWDAGARDLDGEFDEDPPDEPSIQMVSPADAARVAMLSADVLVVDGRPRYHVSGCVHLHGRETEPLPVGEAVELGFTPCALCEPDSALLADARRV